MLAFLLVPVAAIAAAVAIWLSVEDGKRPDAAAITAPPMKVARYYWPGSYWKEIAERKGWFEAAGLNVELVDTNPDYFGSLQDMVDGRLDENGFSIFDLMRFRLGETDLVAVLATDNSFGMEAIVARQEVDSLRELKGRRVGLPLKSYLEYLLDVVLRRAGLDPNDVIKVDVPGERAAEAFSAGSVDAIVAWEPVVSQALDEGGGNKLFDTSQIPGISPGVTVFHRRFIEQRPGDVQAYLNVWQRSTIFIKEHPAEAYLIIAEANGVTPEEAQALAQLDQILNLRDNTIAFTYSAGFESLHGTARHVNVFMREKGMSASDLDSTAFIDGRFVRRIPGT